jgi:hypothetical protein
MTPIGAGGPVGGHGHRDGVNLRLPAPEVRVDEVSDADVEALVALWDECELTRPWNDPRRDIADARAAEDATVLVGRAEIAGAERVVASALVGYDGHRGWMYYVAVDAALRRTGVGRHMVVAAEAWLASRGARKVQLMVRHTNERATGFYEALGYTDQSTAVLGRWLEDA